MTEEIAKLPAPRLQLRWAIPTKEDHDGWHMAPLQPDADGYRTWICNYELVLPLRRHDIRSERDDDEPVDEMVVSMGKTRRGSTKAPDDAPYRDGVHAGWDAKNLGDPPIYVVFVDGSSIRLADLRAKRDAEFTATISNTEAPRP